MDSIRALPIVWICSDHLGPGGFTKELQDVNSEEFLKKQSRPDTADKVIQKALTVFPEALVDEDSMGEITIDTGLSDSDVEALYTQWIELFPDGEMGEGGLIYTGIPA